MGCFIIGIKIHFLGNNYIRNPGDSDKVEKLSEDLNRPLKEAIKHCERLLSYGKEVYLVELGGKDANEIGFERFLENIEATPPLTFSTLVSKKLELI